jgi:glucosyl-3-phosphoglycerate synthase
MRHFHHRQFSDTRALAASKGPQRVSVCIPTLDEAATIGDIVATIRREHMEKSGLVDEILVIDSGSDDDTCQLAAAAGAAVFSSAEILPELGTIRGKGENLWKALHVASGDIICYIDGDIESFEAYYVSGLLGPLLTDATIDYVKAYYERPLYDGNGSHSSGGGRVSEILIRPLLSLFYPELTGVFQPLAGEYAARRTTLESLPFPAGYGVEIAHLIDLFEAGKASALAQVDLVRRIHRNRSDAELGAMAFAILKVVMRRLVRQGRLSCDASFPDLYRSWDFGSGKVTELIRNLPEPERPPVAQRNGSRQLIEPLS